MTGDEIDEDEIITFKENNRTTKGLTPDEDLKDFDLDNIDQFVQSFTKKNKDKVNEKRKKGENLRKL